MMCYIADLANAVKSKKGGRRLKKVSVTNVAKALQVSPDTVRRLCADGLLEHERIGGKRGWLRIYLPSLEAYSEQEKIHVDWSVLKLKTYPYRDDFGKLSVEVCQHLNN